MDANKLGQQHGAIVRAAVINSAVAVRDAAAAGSRVVTETVAPKVMSGAKSVRNVVKPRVSKAAAYVGGMFATLFSK